MTDTSLYIVFSYPPAGVSDAAFETFYERHVEEILTVPGWIAGTRYRVRTADATSAFPYVYLALYRISGDPNDATGRLYAASETDQISIPDWFHDTQWLTWGAPLPSGVRDLLNARTLRLTLRTAENGTPRGDRYTLDEIDVDERLPRYHWMDAACDDDAAAPTGTSGTATEILEMTCAALGSVVGAADPEMKDGHMTEKAQTPESIGRLIIDAVNAGDAHRAAAQYAEDAVVAYPVGKQTVGREAVRAMWAAVIASNPPHLEYEEFLPPLIVGDIALTTSAPPNDAARAHVARRQADGSWLRILDQPYIISPS